jgi:hypothetical protein
MVRVKDAISELVACFKEPVRFFVYGIMGGIFGYFLYYKEEVDVFNVTMFSLAGNHIDQAFNGGIGGLLVVLLSGLIIFRAGGHIRPKRAVCYIIGGWSITIFATLLDLII